jgi:hypothetical protein
MNRPTSIFNIGLLDDLHTYFPDVLYNPDRFETVSDLLRYIVAQARAIRSPFERGQEIYTNRINNVIVPNQIPIVDNRNYTTSNIPVTPARTYAQAAQAPMRRSIPATYYYQRHNYNDNMIGLNALTNLFTMALEVPMTDVPVIPTNQQVDLATAILTEVTTSEPCAICQDTMDGTPPFRRINRCQHTFHQSCIDTWFGSGVTCPICRIDIRD